MCVNREANRLIGKLPYRRKDLVGQRSKLAIDHEHAIRAREYADCGALPFEYMKDVREVCGSYLDFAEVDDGPARWGGSGATSAASAAHRATPSSRIRQACEQASS
jgi:hypothetical protein